MYGDKHSRIHVSQKPWPCLPCSHNTPAAVRAMLKLLHGLYCHRTEWTKVGSTDHRRVCGVNREAAVSCHYA